MPFSSPSAAHVNTPLTNVAIAYTQRANGFVADRIFPNVNVQKQSDKYWIFDRAETNRDEFAKRAPATESRGATLTLSDDTYFAEKWALHYDIPDEHRANADSAINLDRLTTQRLIGKGLLKREINFVDRFMASGVWTTQRSGVAASPNADNFLQWNDANSTPIEDVQSYMTAMQALTGYRPNKMVITQQVKDKLVRHPDIIDLIKYGGNNTAPAVVSDAALAAIFDIPNLFTMGAVRNSAAEGDAESNAFIGGKKALLLYSPETPSIDEPSAGYTFNWTQYLGNSPNGIRVKTFRMEKIEADRVEAEMFYDQKKTAADLGVYLDSVIA